jgi:serine/threonine protein kinase
LFEKEAEIMSQIVHLNVIRLIESFWVQRKFCIVIEFADGGSLQEKISQKFGENDVF